MCYCFQTFKELSAPGTLPDFVFAARFFRSGCKGMSLYNFNQIFLLFFEVFSSLSEPEDLKNCRFFLKRVAKLQPFIISPNFSAGFRRFFSSQINQIIRRTIRFF